jgi:capsular polysaccharide export protein
LPDRPSSAAAGETLRRLYVYNGGFLTNRRVRRILQLAGHDIRLGWPGADDMVGIWGQSPTAGRGMAVAARSGAGLLRVEDAFLRSVLPGRAGDPPLGLHLDRQGVHFDGTAPSDLETLLATHPLDDPALITRAMAAVARLRAAHLTKYTAFDPAAPVPAPGFVLVIDQTLGDASVRASGADRETFRQMLAVARAEHPDRLIVVKSHPETTQGHRAGHLDAADLPPQAMLLRDPVGPWALFDHALAVYTLSSQMGFEAIMAGHRPIVFGQPFYAGWGLSDDRAPIPRRTRTLTMAQLFAAAMILYPLWYDPYRDRLCPLEDAITTLEAQTRAWRDDHKGWVAAGMRLWKRKPLQAFFGKQKAMIFAEGNGAPDGRRLMVWAGKATPDMAGAVRVEDGFLRSRGLGADLVPPLSLCLDDLGIYYDPSRESRLERLIADSVDLPADARDRAMALIERLTGAGLSKYNLGGAGLPTLPNGQRILVPGQVEDDASIRLGAGVVNTNRGLLLAARQANPDAVILYKPHPDVEAGLRPGIVADAGDFADVILDRTDPVAALDAVDAVWTMTSTLGFEALLRGKAVVCLGAPFYAGWGLTDDRGPALPRRRARPDLAALVHATLIQYPRYHDPVTNLPCPVEVIVDRLAAGTLPRPGPVNRLLAKAQGALATHAAWWR